jgi:hypothetical protein
MKPLNFIPKEYYKNVYIVVREGEQELKYRKYKELVNLISLPNLTGIHDKRDAIVKFFNGERIWMIDDDR